MSAHFCIISILTVFIIIIRSSTSFDDVDQPEDINVTCGNSTITVTLDNDDEFSLFSYVDSNNKTRVDEISDEYEYNILNSDLKDNKTIVQFSIIDEIFLMTSQKYEVDCSGPIGSATPMHETIDVVVENATSSDGSVGKMTLTPSSFNFMQQNNLTLILPKSYEKAMITSCEMRAPNTNYNEWINIHDCFNNVILIILKISHTTGTNVINATVYPAIFPDAKSMEIRCEFEGCNGDCIDYDKKYLNTKCVNLNPI